MGSKVNEFKVGDLRLRLIQFSSLSRFEGPPGFPVQLLREHWGPYEEKASWVYEDMRTGEECDPLAEIWFSEETLNAMEVLAWSAV